MKKFKKTMALMLTLVMCLSMMSVAAFAAGEHAATDNEHKLTITPSNKATAHTYEAYQIFSGVLDGDASAAVEHPAQVNLIQWGSNVDGDKLLAALKEDTTNFNYVATDPAHNDFTNCNDAADVAAVLATYSNDDANMRAFAAIIGDTTKAILKGAPKMATAAAGNSVEFTGMSDGYYFIQDKANSQDDENGSYTRFVLQVVGDTTVNAKDILPDIKKEILTGKEDDEDTEEVDESVTDKNSANIGDKISYKVTGEVPDMDGYDSYVYQITDTMSKGLTFNEDAVIKVGDTTLSRVYKGANGYYYPTEAKANVMNAVDPAGADAVTQGYTINSTTDSTTGVTTFTIYIVNFIQYNVKVADDPDTAADGENSIVGKPIVVTYSATINQDAVITDGTAAEGNTNTAKLTYSNNPNKSGKGENGEPDSDNPTGDGPDKIVRTYTTGLELLKVDGQNSSKKLEGAAFKIEGNTTNVTIVKEGMFVVATDEELATGGKYENQQVYYMLKDGTYSTDDPNAADMDATKYVKITTVTKDQNDSATSTTSSVTGSDGLVSFSGLGEGLYTLTETQAPTGYNLLSDPIYVYVKFVQDATDATKGEFEVYQSKETTEPTISEDTNFADTDKWTKLGADANSSTVLFDMTITNNSGSELPSTGGIGTTIFYLIGAILVIGAGVLLVTRRRMRTN